jgi:trehalose-6-phosphate synthase
MVKMKLTLRDEEEFAGAEITLSMEDFKLPWDEFSKKILRPMFKEATKKWGKE